MRRVVLSLVLCLLPGVALAASWIVQMEEDEGGPVMVASVTGEADGELQPMLRMMCSSEGVNLRYEMANNTASPGSEADFRFENEHDQVTLHMLYEDMDGAFAAYLAATDPVVALLKSGADVSISETTGNYPAQNFPLKGSAKAIDGLLASCQ